MKRMKRSGIYQASNYNCTFNPQTLEAHSYKWWKFVAKVEGKIVFNDYKYSVSTSKHQRKVRNLLQELGIKIDISLPLPQGIVDQSLVDIYLKAEEYLCDEINADEIKRQERNEKAKIRRLTKKLSDHLENDIHFRDYEIKTADQFGKYNKIAIHQVVSPESLADDVQNALYNFSRDGFGLIVFYVGSAQ